MIKTDIFRKEKAALDKAEQLGCEGTHKHDNGFMPCKSHEEWEKVTSNNEDGGEIEELVDFDGTMMNSKIPIIDPKVTNKGMDTTDKAVAAGHTRQDPYALGFRRYVGEEDMSGAFGVEETEEMDFDDTVKYLEDVLGVDNAEERAEEMGKDPNLEKKKTDGAFTRMRLQEKEKMFTKEQIIKMKEDLLMDKDADMDVQPVNKTMSKIILRNLKALKTLAKKEGISTNQLAKYLRDEQ
jgi:hypothetical protein